MAEFIPETEPTTAEASCIRLRLLERLAKLKGIEASLLTTYSVNLPVYEDVLLRHFTRAGSRLNILLVDAGQLAMAMADPLLRPRRAGLDYVLLPVQAPGAFHPKVFALLGAKRSFLAVGSHNVTEAGLTRNAEVSVCWGHDGAAVPGGVMGEVVEDLAYWLSQAPGLERPLADEILGRLRQITGEPGAVGDPEATFAAWHPGSESLLDQLYLRVAGVAHRVVLTGPFFDDRLALLDAVARTFAPAEIVVGLQSHAAMLAAPHLAPPTVRFVDAGVLPPQSLLQVSEHTSTS
ncbi:hypothetical protein GAY28_03695 [Azospirillum brasilense]|nr:hypothetical protein [Azospirillum brasilense]